MSDRYRQAGVDIDAADEAIRRFGRHVDSTRVPGVVGSIGGFGGLFDLRAAGLGPEPILVSGADGVGTKLELAFLTGRHDTVGIDCVAMCVNDILTLGARPLFFLDYLAVGKLQVGVAEAIVAGVATGCREAGCALLGGETAELPGFYAEGEYDLAGFAVGAVDRAAIVDGGRIVDGDRLIGLRSSGFHSNGYSLIRKELVEGQHEALSEMPGTLDAPLGEVLLRPTRIYARQVLPLLSADGPIHGMVHVTGGGLLDNAPRVLPDGLGARFDQDALDALSRPEFDLVRELGGVPWREMYRVFNMGVGFVLAVDAAAADELVERLGAEASIVGEVVPIDSLGDHGPIDIPRARETG